MKLEDLRDILVDNMSFRDDLIMDKTFVGRAERGIDLMCQKTMPLALTDSDPNGKEVVRVPLPHTYIMKHPRFDRTLTEGQVDGTQEIQLESELVEGVASYMATKYEPQNRQLFFTEMWDAINNHRKMIMDSPWINDSEGEYEHEYI